MWIEILSSPLLTTESLFCRADEPFGDNDCSICSVMVRLRISKLGVQNINPTTIIRIIIVKVDIKKLNNWKLVDLQRFKMIFKVNFGFF